MEEIFALNRESIYRLYVFLNDMMIGNLHDFKNSFMGRTLSSFLLLFVCKCNWIDAISSKKLDPRIDLSS